MGDKINNRCALRSILVRKHKRMKRYNRSMSRQQPSKMHNLSDRERERKFLLQVQNNRAQ